jgi:nicotinate-nucleotide adenylyltransferase
MTALNHDTPRRIGLFGGTFNPIHCGHVQVAKDVLHRYRLTAIQFIPSALPPHKTEGILATAADRYAMACRALEDEPALKVSDIEIQRSGRSYTIDTLHRFMAGQPHDPHLFFMVGLDAFLEIHTWKAYRQLFDLTAFIVMTRPQASKPDQEMTTLTLQLARERISDAYQLSKEGDRLVHPEKQVIYLAPVTPMDISSSRIRTMIHKGQSIHQWVAPTVEAYIESKGLYR